MSEPRPTDDAAALVSLTQWCGHHCGIITVGLSHRVVGHCPCPECHNSERADPEVQP